MFGKGEMMKEEENNEWEYTGEERKKGGKRGRRRSRRRRRRCVNEGKQDDEWKEGEKESKSVGRKPWMREGGKENTNTHDEYESRQLE